MYGCFLDTILYFVHAGTQEKSLTEAKKILGAVDKWFAVGLYLDLPISYLRDLLAKNMDNESRIDKILKEWMSRPEDQRLKLKDALKIVGETSNRSGSGPGI